MAVRDRLAALALVLGLLSAIAGWRLAGPWAGMVLAMAGMAAAALVYGYDPAGPEDRDTAPPPVDELSTRRPAAAPPSRSGRGS